jgi:hypothetical protein
MCCENSSSCIEVRRKNSTGILSTNHVNNRDYKDQYKSLPIETKLKML